MCVGYFFVVPKTENRLAMPTYNAGARNTTAKERHCTYIPDVLAPMNDAIAVVRQCSGFWENIENNASL